MKKQLSAKRITVIFISSLIVFGFIYTSCKKKDECVAGTGGAVAIAAFPQHHSVPIVSDSAHLDTAYVKFNTQDFPGEDPSKYDLVIAGEAGEDHVHIENLKCGDYYIWMTGFDPSINMRVTGGIPYSFTQTSGEIDVIVPVTE